jgi:hypothetical protein
MKFQNGPSPNPARFDQLLDAGVAEAHEREFSGSEECVRRNQK